MAVKNSPILKRSIPGFTLIELLVVVAILGLLASILVAALNQARIKSRDAKRVADLNQLTTAMELYYNNKGQYPPLTVEVVWTGNWCDQTPSCQAQADQNWNGMIADLRADGDLAEAESRPKTWLQRLADFIPLLPHADAAGTSLLQDPLYPVQRYEYMPSAAPLNQNYRLRVLLENSSDVALQNSVHGKFFWSEDFKSTGPDSCDPTLNFYCTGPAGTYEAFDPGKPVIYLYPQKTEQVSVKVYPLSVDQSVPAYGQGWNVIAHPGGRLQNLADGQTYPYLFWEGRSTRPAVDETKGFVVADKDIEGFLMNSLQKQGLSQPEARDFTAYWAPRMHGKPYVYVYFMPQADYDKLVPLEITPRPDTVIRVYMLFKQLDAPVSVIPEKFTAPARKGFTAVEWGGDRSQIHQ